MYPWNGWLRTYICAKELRHRVFKWWLVACSALRHYLNQCFLWSFKSTLRNKRGENWLKYDFLLNNLLQKVCNTLVIVFIPEWTHSSIPSVAYHKVRKFRTPPHRVPAIYIWCYFSKNEISQVFAIHSLKKNKDIALSNRYHYGCWWPGDVGCLRSSPGIFRPQ